MKKVIFVTMVSLCVLSGFVAGPLEPGLAGAGGTCVQEGTSTPYNQLAAEAFGPDVELAILVKKGGTIELMPAANKTLKKPKKQGNGPHSGEVPGPESVDRTELPVVLDEDIPAGSKFQRYSITIYGKETCGNIGGAWVCW